MTERPDGERAVTMLGKHGVTLVPVGVDADGNLVAVMKGSPAVGVLATVKLDSQGRMYAYVSDEADQWGNTLPTGLTELAARLGSIVSYDRRGQTVVLDDFSAGWGSWRTSGSGTPVSAISCDYCMSAGYSAYLETEAVADAWIYATRYIGSFPAQRAIGLGFWLMYYSFPGYWSAGYDWGDGTTLWQPRVKGQYSDGKVYLYNSVGGWTEIGTWDVGALGDQGFRFIKLVMDPTTGKYDYVVIDGVEYDASAVAVKSSTTASRYIYLTLMITANGATAAKMYLDNVVLTTTE